MTKKIIFALACAYSVTAQVAEEAPKPIPASIPQAVRNTNQFQRFWYSYSIRSNADNQIPNGVLPPAATLMNAAPAAVSPAPTGPSPAPLFTGARWKAVGPAPILGGQIGAASGTRPMAGRMNAIAVDPTNVNHWLVGGAQGGVWETTNAGNNWVALTDALPSLAVGAIAFAPSNPRILYLGTGEANNSADSYGGQGFFRSTDGGLNWTRMSTTHAYGAYADLWVDPTNPNILLATVNYGVFGRAAFFPPSALLPPVGIFRSTNAGATWTQVSPSGIPAYALAVNPSNKQQAIAGVSNSQAGASATNGVYRTTDNGQTWSILSSAPWHNNGNGVGRIELTIAASAPATAYVSIERANTGGLLGLWRTDNLWAATPTWTQISTAAADNNTGAGYCGWDRAFASLSNQCWYSHVVAADPTNANILYAGGIPMWKFDGTTWTEISRSASDQANGMHVDQHAIAFAGSRVIFGNDGGIWSTTDGGATILVHNAGLSTVQFYEGAVSSLGGLKRLAGGSQDNGTEASDDGGANWNLILGGDGAAVSYSPTTQNNMFASSQGLALRRSTTGGAVFSSTTTGLDRTSTQFISKVEQCPWDENVVLAGNRTAQKRTDYYSGAPGATWPASTMPITFNSGVSALGFGSTCSVYGVASRSFGFLVTRDAGATWANLGSLVYRPVSDFAFVPGDDTQLIATIAAFDQDTPTTPGHILKITGLDTATPVGTRINTGLNLPHNTIVIDPGNPSIVYVGTDMGVLRSTDGGTTWAPMGIGSGMPNVAVHDMKYTPDGRLVAFTHGRGAFELVGYDLDNNNAVGCSDLNVIRNSFGKRAGQAGFNPVADLNNDYQVDVRDLRMITRQLPTGTVCP